ncbi:ubiquinone/menaquinone biosynthesis methyltransferase [bacterium]|nr:ubiquinone/menaquinone biosynthesis methyltransferase [bacterium]
MKNPEDVKILFNKLAKNYDLYNRIISLGMQTRVKKDCLKLLNVSSGYKILDICTGTGDLAFYLNKINPDTDIIGIDFSEKMLETANKKKKDRKNIQFLIADGREIPFEDNTFDIVTIGFGLRNIENYERVIDEIKRVLKPQGQVLNLDFSCDDGFFNSVFDMLTQISTAFTGKKSSYDYLIESKKNFLNTTELISLFRKKEYIFLRRKYYAFKVVAAEIFRNNKKI